MFYFKDEISKSIINKLKENIYTILKRTLNKFWNRYPKIIGRDGIYEFDEKFFDEWSCGFWIGIFYMAYEMFDDKSFLNYAENLSSYLYEITINGKIDILGDEGMIYLPSCARDFKLSQSSEAVEMMCYAADHFIARKQHRKIKLGISDFQLSDLSNLSLIHIVARLSNDCKYTEYANQLQNKILNDNISPDGVCKMYSHKSPRSNHNVRFEKEILGKYNEIYDMQFAQSWGLHGLSLLYSRTGDAKYLEMSHRVLSHYLSSYFDNAISFDSKSDSDGNFILSDTTSMCRVNCALLEIVRRLPENSPYYDRYLAIVRYNMLNIINNYFISCESGTQALLSSAILIDHKNYNKNILSNNNIMADYFLMESLLLSDSEYQSCWNIDVFK